MSTKDIPSHPLFAVAYDLVTKQADEIFFREHREYLATDLHGTVLDFGGGTGAMFPYFKMVTQQDSSIVLQAIEPDPHMKRRAVQRANNLSLDITIRSEKAQSLPYSDDSLDVVIVSLVFCTIPNIEVALDEVVRILKLGGELRFLEHIHADGWLAYIQNTVNPIWRIVASGCHLNRDTVTIFKDDNRFEVLDLEELEINVPLVKPFVRGTLIRKNS